MDALRDVARISLLEVLCQVILAQRMPATCDESTTRVTDENPNDVAQSCLWRVGPFKLWFFRQQAELQDIVCQGVPSSIESNSRRG